MKARVYNYRLSLFIEGDYDVSVAKDFVDRLNSQLNLSNGDKLPPQTEWIVVGIFDKANDKIRGVELTRSYVDKANIITVPDDLLEMGRVYRERRRATRQTEHLDNFYASKGGSQ